MQSIDVKDLTAPTAKRVANLRERLFALAKRDAESVFKKDMEYGHSWRKRGGVGAFFVIARKWDRLEERLKQIYSGSASQDVSAAVSQYDLFGHITADNREEGIIDDVRDLRRYLLLVEEEMMERGALRDILGHGKVFVSPFTGDKQTIKLGSTEHPHPFGYEPEQDDPPKTEVE